jgi:hypothetical protein
VLLYSYDNKKCVHAKYIMNNIKLSLWKDQIQDQIISFEQELLVDPLTKALPPNVLREHTINMGLW